MKRRINKQHRNYLILGLCCLLVVMTVGYAVFSTSLNISGTTSIASSFNVRITNIESKNIVGNASNAISPTYSATTATFATNLELPGDSITYDITVSNNGTIDAILDDIQVSNSNNPAIVFEQSGITEGSTLRASETAVLTIKVTYSNLVTSQPENTTSDFTVTLTYEQKGSSSVTPTPSGPTIGGQYVEVVSTGDGLYEDEYEAGRYVYKGTNPNNYIEFANGEIWRIISIETDGTYKIVRNDLLSEGMQFDAENSNDWNTASLNEYLNGSYLTRLDSSIKKYIVPHTWGIGPVELNNEDLSAQISSENSMTWTGSVGLISHSDYLRANSDMTNCGTDKTNYANYETCRNLDWMYIPGSYYWTISPGAAGADRVWSVSGDGILGSNDADISYGVRPAVYLTSNLTLTGSGTIGDPYIPVN